MADAAQKPSFLSSMWSGVKGYIKGGLVGTVIGMALGAAIGAIIGAPADFTYWATTLGEKTALFTGTAAAAATGATVLGAVFGSVGALSGMATDVVRSRETAQPSANDIVNVAKVSYAQGIATGHAIAQEQEAEQTTFRDRIAKERAAVTTQQGQAVH